MAKPLALLSNSRGWKQNRKPIDGALKTPSSAFWGPEEPQIQHRFWQNSYFRETLAYLRNSFYMNGDNRPSSRRIFTRIVLTLLISACSTSTQVQKEKTNPDSASTNLNTEVTPRQDNQTLYSPTDAIWEYSYDTLIKDFALVQLRKIDKDTITGNKLETIINGTWPQVQIQFLKTSGDTAFVFIKNSDFLTQKMGTSGADAFMISTTYTFTELSEIQYVSYFFEAGEHASPGVYSRKYWKTIVKSF